LNYFTGSIIETQENKIGDGIGTAIDSIKK